LSVRNVFFLCFLTAGGPPEPADPPLSDLANFPPAAVVRNELAMNEPFQDYLRGRLELFLHQRDTLGAELRAAEFVWECWDALRDAQCSYYPEEFRRRRLAELRRRIGPEAYQLGVMPAGVPFWKFPEID
jgi:hypothetical protein